MWQQTKSQQDGAALVMVLLFTTIFGLIVTGLLTEGTASVKYSQTVSAHENKVYASDAGVSFAMQQLRQNNEVCPSQGSTGAFQNITVNGETVSTTCTGTKGSVLGASGYAIITTSPGTVANPSLTLPSGGEKVVTGPVYLSGGVDDWSALTVHGGNLHQSTTSGCTLGASTPPAGLTLDNPPYVYSCEVPNIPAVAHDAPGGAPTTSVTWPLGHRPPTTSGSCTTWYPGLYQTPPSLTSPDNYFASGVYYFDFTDANDNNNVFDVSQNLYGGQPSSGESRSFTAPSCATSDPSVSEVTGTGVELVFGSRARMFVEKVTMELFSRSGGSGTSGVSLVAVPTVASPPNAQYASDVTWGTASPAWHANTTTGWTTPLIDMHNGNVPNMTIHGLFYGYGQNARLWATNDVNADIAGGIVVANLQLQSSASGNGLGVSVQGGTPPPRSVLVTASAIPAGSPERAVQSTAVIVVNNDLARTAKIESWRTRGPSDTL